MNQHAPVMQAVRYEVNDFVGMGKEVARGDVVHWYAFVPDVTTTALEVVGDTGRDAGFLGRSYVQDPEDVALPEGGARLCVDFAT